MTIESYRRINIYTPMIGLTFALIVIIINLYYFFVLNKTKVFHLIFVFFALFLLVKSEVTQIVRGISLLVDQETMKISGYIEEVIMMSDSPRYHINDKPTHACYIVVDGVKFHTYITDDTVKGNYVSFTYLEESKFVLDYIE